VEPTKIPLTLGQNTKEIKLISTEQKGEMQMPKEMSMKEMGMSKEISMNGRGGHLYMQTNEVKNTIIHYHRSANGTLTEVERVAPAVQARGLSSRSAARRAHPTPLKARLVSSSHQIASFCLPQTVGTIRFPASPWATMAGSR